MTMQTIKKYAKSYDGIIRIHKHTKNGETKIVAVIYNSDNQRVASFVVNN